MISECRLCGGSNLRPWMRDGRDRNLVYYRCDDCSLWNYDLDCGVDQTQYTEVYISPRDAGHRSNRLNLDSWKFVEQFARTPRSIMDIGCGNGGLLHLARESGWEVAGMELSQQAADAIREDQGIDVIVSDFLHYENPEGRRYDVVALRHVLEHLPDPILAMQKIGGLLKDNGLALLEFPNTGSFSYRLKRILKNRGLKNAKYPADWRPGHVNEYCRKSFRYLLDRTGFELAVWRTYSNKPVANAFYRWVPIASKVRVLVRKLPAAGTRREAA
jgi:SAM-dependent methyltransferase